MPQIYFKYFCCLGVRRCQLCHVAGEVVRVAPAEVDSNCSGFIEEEVHQVKNCYLIDAGDEGFGRIADRNGQSTWSKDSELSAEAFLSMLAAVLSVLQLL